MFEQISRSGLYLNGITDAEKRVDSLLDARDVTDQSDLEPEPFAFSQVFIFIEQVMLYTIKP